MTIKVSVPLQDVRVQDHQEAVFECSVALSPLLVDADLAVRWEKDNQALPEIEKYEYLDETDDQSNMKTQLKIVSADKESKDMGEYRVRFCLDSTELASSAAKLTFADEAAESTLRIKTPLARPITVKANEKKATLFTEYTESIAKHRIEWYKNGQQLKFTTKSLKYKQVVSVGKCTLEITEFSSEDIGHYELKVFSDANLTRPVSQQETEVELAKGVAVVVEGLSDVNVEEGDTARLTFKASQECMCEWYQFKDDPRRTLKNFTAKMVAAVRCEKVTADDRTVFSCKADGVFGLTFHDAQVKDSCYYVAMLTADGVEAAGSDPLVFTCGRLSNLARIFFRFFTRSAKKFIIFKFRRQTAEHRNIDQVCREVDSSRERNDQP